MLLIMLRSFTYILFSFTQVANKNNIIFNTISNITLCLLVLRPKQGCVQNLVAYEFNRIIRCTNFEGLAIVIRNYVRDVPIYEHL
jgi:hypothetical protein